MSKKTGIRTPPRKKEQRSLPPQTSRPSTKNPSPPPLPKSPKNRHKISPIHRRVAWTAFGAPERGASPVAPLATPRIFTARGRAKKGLCARARGISSSTPSRPFLSASSRQTARDTLGPTNLQCPHRTARPTSHSGAKTHLTALKMAVLLGVQIAEGITFFVRGGFCTKGSARGTSFSVHTQSTHFAC